MIASGFARLTAATRSRRGWMLPIWATITAVLFFYPGLVLLWWGAETELSDDWNTAAALRSPLSWIGALMLAWVVIAPPLFWSALAVTTWRRLHERRRVALE